MVNLLVGLVFAIVVLLIHLRDAAQDAAYWRAEDERHREMLYRAWEQQREMLEGLKDAADWWKE